MNIKADVEKVSHISIIPTILEIICRTTDMGFAAVARVTEDRWVACEVRDEIMFGLISGGELKVDTTICHEIRQSGKEVVIDHVAKDDIFHNHHTPAMYGFQSYISVPIIRRKDEFFGTLCAIDPTPSLLNTPEMIGMFKTYAELISFHLNALERLPATEIKLLEDKTREILNKELAFLSEHHLARDANATSASAHASQQRLSYKRSKEFAALIYQSSSRVKEHTSHLRQLYATQ